MRSDGTSVSRITLVQDAVELTRQPHADVSEFFEECLKRTLGEGQFKLQVVAGNRAVREISSLHVETTDLIIFASNAIIRTDSDIYKAFESNADTIQKYVANGGGIILLHQGFAGLDSGIEGLRFTGAEKFIARDLILRNTETTLTSKFARDHSLLNFPHVLDLAELVEDESGLTPSGVPLGYFAIKPAEFTDTEKLQPVIEFRPGYYSLATYSQHGRIIYCTYPADWAKNYKLTVNVLHFAIFGAPKAIILGSTKTSTTDPDADYWGMNRIRLLRTSNFTEIMPEEISAIGTKDSNPIPEFVLGNAEVLVMEGLEDFDSVAEALPVKDMLSRGGTLIAAENRKGTGDEVVYEDIRMLVGTGGIPPRLRNARILLAYLVAKNWFATALIHDIRDVLLALATIVEPDELSELLSSSKNSVKKRIKEWFDGSDASLDIGTALTAAWVDRVVSGGYLDYRIRQIIQALEPASSDTEFAALQQVLLFGQTSLAFTDIFQHARVNSWGAAVRIIDCLRMLKVAGYELAIPTKEQDSLSATMLESLNEQPELIDFAGSNIAALSAAASFWLGSRADYGNGSRRKLAELGACADAVLKLGLDKLYRAENDRLQQDSSATPSSSTPSPEEIVRCIIALSILNEIESKFPNRLVSLAATFANSDEHPLDKAAVSPQSEYILGLLTKVSELGDREYRTQEELLRYKTLLTNARQETADHFQIHISVAAVTCWVSVLGMVVGNGFLFVKAIYEWLSTGIIGDAFATFWMVVLPSTLGIYRLYRSGLLALSPVRNYLNNPDRKTPLSDGGLL